jgi:hypothetical protein
MTEEMKSAVKAWKALTNKQQMEFVAMFGKEIRSIQNALVEADIAYVEELINLLKGTE